VPAVVLVGIAGVAGVLARYGITKATMGTEALIWSTAAINIVGSFLLGVFVAAGWFSRDYREAIGVGFLGGFTTFSTFTVQIVTEADGGRTGTAAAYLAVSVVGGLAAAIGGYALGRAVT
jgi:CrcB protein